MSNVSKERKIIAFFGLRNSGKSSLVNAVTSQSMSIVSDYAGTTTDPVSKTMELLPIGPVMIIDTPGLDDVGELGEMRVKRTKEILRKTDIAVLVIDAAKGVSMLEIELVAALKQRKLPFVIAFNKMDLLRGFDSSGQENLPNTQNEKVSDDLIRGYLAELCAKDADFVLVSALHGENITRLKECISKLHTDPEKYIVMDILKPKDTVVLVLPIDESAPKGRLILPQQQVLRELLDHHCKIICTQVEELADVLHQMHTRPDLVITDSQAFEAVDLVVPKKIPLTSFSILFARYKGSLSGLLRGANKLGELQEGDTVLIAEGCTHHRQCNDIGSVKLPNWIQGFCKKNLQFEYSSGNEFKEDLEKYALVVHCGGCMLNEKEMQFRMQHAKSTGKEMVNFGIAIAKMHGILDRAIAPFAKKL